MSWVTRTKEPPGYWGPDLREEISDALISARNALKESLDPAVAPAQKQYGAQIALDHVTEAIRNGNLAEGRSR
jgi:hypothetical protein